MLNDLHSPSTRNSRTRDFVEPHSIVRAIWGDPDLTLLIFAGAAAEFALNRAVDWLFFTGRIPSDPIGRLFSTVRYAQEIVFTTEATAQQTLAQINAIHGAVEQKRGQTIPAWAYRDVLYMLIDYSERAHHVLYRKLTAAERQELYTVFRRVGEGLHVADLPLTYAAWRPDRERHLARDLVYSRYTAQLFRRYHEELGEWRYRVLRWVQAALVPQRVRGLLHFRSNRPLRFLIRMYGRLSRFGLRYALHEWVIPPRYREQVRALAYSSSITKQRSA